MSEVAFPYPVLGRADDYLDVDFQASLKLNDAEVINEEKYNIPYVFDLNDEAILDQITAGNAKYGFEISCSGTSIRYVQFTQESGEILN